VCERGVTVPMTRVSDAKGAIVVMNIDGRQITLHAEPDADGMRFSWPSGGSRCVWAEALGIASVLWRDGSERGNAFGRLQARGMTHRLGCSCGLGPQLK